MKNLIFVCGGGFSLELLDYISKDIDEGLLTNLRLKGILDDNPDIKSNELEHLGEINSYKVLENDIFIICLGSTNSRRSIYESLKLRNANFLTYIHSSVYVSKTSKISDSVIICPNSIINSFASVNSNTVINVNSSIGHEVTVGSHCVLSPYSIMNGGSSLGDEVFIGTNSTIYPGINVGNNVIIDSHTPVNKNVEDDMIASLKSKLTIIKNRFLRWKCY